MKNRKKLIGLITFYLLIIFTVTTTFAWFFINKEIEVEYGSEIICEAGTSLELSLYEGIDEETSEELWTDYSGYVKYDGIAAKIQDITGNGKNLYRPTGIETNPDTGELYPGGLTVASKTDTTGYGDYIELEVKMRSTSNMNVYLSGDSIVEPIHEFDTDKNIFGNFSKDFIVGAIRVAVLEKAEDGSEELKMLWAPMPKIELIKNPDHTYRLEQDGDIETYYYYKFDEASGKPIKHEVTSEEYASKLFVIGSTNTTESMVNNSPVLTTLSPSIDEVVEKRMVIRVWFEGTDREADQALGGGQVSMNLKFVGMLEKDAQSEDVTQMMDSISFTEEENNITKIENITEDVYYSIDGYTWLKCSESGVNNLISAINNRTKDLKVYLKYLESATCYEYMVTHTFTYTEGGENNE